MYYYFSADYQSAIKINGIFKHKLIKGQPPFILTDKDLSIESQIFVELCPLNGDEYPVSFMLDDEFLANPPKSIMVVNLKGGYFIKFLSLLRLAPFSVIDQRKLPYAIATVFKENGLKVSIETPNDFYAENLNFDCSQAEILDFSLNGNQIIAINFKGEVNSLYCYHLGNKITKVFCREVQSFCTDNGFSTTQVFEDIRGHKVVCDWVFQDLTMKIADRKISYEKDLQIENLPDKIIGYAFLEEFLVGGEIKEFLCEQMQDNARYLKDYFSDFIGVFPPPWFRDFNEIALLYKKSSNTYYVNYYQFEIENKKIKNIKRLDN